MLLPSTAENASPDLPPHAQYIKTYLGVMCLTRSSTFLHWTNLSVEKAFKWSSIIAQYSTQIEKDFSCNALFRKTVEAVDTSACEFLNNTWTALRDPVLLMQKAILTSPLLPWCINAEDIIGVCLLHTTSSLVLELADILQTSLKQQREREDAKRMRFSYTSDNLPSNCMSEFMLSSIAITFLISMSEVALQQSDTPSCDSTLRQCALPKEVLEKLADACDWSHGPLPITIVICALMMSPGTIVTSPLVMKTVNSESSLIEAEGIVVYMSKSLQLWGVVETLARRDIAAFESVFNMNECSSVLSLKRLYQVSPSSLQACISYEVRGSSQPT